VTAPESVEARRAARPVGSTDPDRLAALEEERRFLLRSLADLDREYQAGDIDEHDYRELRDGYTVRAAATLRAIEDGRSALPPKPAANWTRRLLIVVLTVALIGIVWWALAASSAQRLAGQTPTGFDPRDERTTLIAQARAASMSDPAGAAELYGMVLDSEPDDVEALTYRGWTLALSTRQMEDSDAIVTTLTDAVESLGRAIEVDPDYADPYCFLGIIQARFLDLPDSALGFLDECLAANPPADVAGMVQALRDSVAAESG